MTCALTDRFGRTIRYLRLSVTDRCDLRCVYCMAEDMQFVPKRDLLTLEELGSAGVSLAARGVNKIRITGGEPLVRKDIMALFRSLSRHLQGGVRSRSSRSPRMARNSPIMPRRWPPSA